MMTELLEKAISKLKALPTEEQNAIASLILDELEDDQRWEESFASSADMLAKLGAEAIAEGNSRVSSRQDGRIKPRNTVKSRTTAQFRKLFNALPESIPDLDKLDLQRTLIPIKSQYNPLLLCSSSQDLEIFSTWSFL
ncbi:hypothetical protein ACVWYZ_002566 [Thermostichus sp. MS-CIW-37]